MMDQTTARALTEAGYMPLAEYVRLYAPNPKDNDKHENQRL